ncbi:cytochrome b/b6 domain-containing protein [Asticcacaulis sp. AC402]|uniref:cytochrome b/b6 domain-containing protein n=1 Tax=Asticcacaulis sp. AC402 TaxID=1282361 RepID=UPI0003C40078|nr:cytochrome b/b6 domain-containing protein [Asticcacaulis sp. AC402]ESQ74185.1 hypothetical protein ABAC402_15370 [Asticcacaulis sp. AC402]
MTALNQLRTYHAVLAVLVSAAFLTTEWGRIHIWLGYGVIAVLLARLGMALSGAHQLGLMRFYPHFEGLKLNNLATHPAISRTLLLTIAACLLTVTATGLFMDKGRTLTRLVSPVTTSPTVAPGAVFERGDADNDKGERGEGAGGGHDRDGGWLGEVHEVSGNLLMLVVVLHVTYLFAFKRPLARFMLFFEAKKPPK